MSEKIIQLLNQCPRLELYLDNGFRRLGLRVPVDSRAVARRLEELRVALELGQAVGGWAFAPVGEVSGEALRETARRLQEPARRLLDELFWFWPAAYPNDGDDPALDAFMAGDTAAATAAWSAAAGRGEPAGWHNIAVYQHLLAVEWLDSPDADPETVRALWRDAVDYWGRVLADDEVWRRVAARVAGINDPQLPASAAAALREGLPALLAGVHAQAAARLAGRGDVAAAGFQLQCATTLCPRADVAALLEPVAQPACRRLASHLAETRRSGPPRPGELTALWEAVRADLTTLQGLGEPLAEARAQQERHLAEVVSERVEAGLAGDPASAPRLLVHTLILLDLAAPGPAAARAGTLFSETLRTALTVAPGRGGEGERIRRLLRDDVVPALGRLRLTPRLHAALVARIAAWTQMLAETAVGASPAMLPWALGALALSSDLPLDEESRQALDSTLASWAVEPRAVHRPAFERSVGGHALRVDVVGVTLDGVRIEAAQLTGVCHPLAGFGPGGEGSAVMRWSDATRVVELPAEFLATEAALSDVLTAFYQLVLPNLVRRLLEAIRSGARVPMGPLQLHADGIFTSDSSNARPYASLRLASDVDGVTLTDVSAPGFSQKLDPANDWNVSLLPLLILILTPR